MPHLILESTLAPEALDPRALLQALHHQLLASGVFDGPDIKGRVLPLGPHQVGDGQGPQAFVHVTLKLLAGRPPAVRQALAQGLLDTLSAQPGLAGRGVQLSVELLELNPTVYAKRAAS